MFVHDSALLGCAARHHTEGSQAAINVAIVSLAIAGADAVKLLCLMQVIHLKRASAESHTERLQLYLVVLQAIRCSMLFIHIERIIKRCTLWAAGWHIDGLDGISVDL